RSRCGASRQLARNGVGGGLKYAIAQLIGVRVVARRTRRRLTQQQVAERIGISRQALSSIERGAQTPHWPTLYAVAGVLHCDIYALLPTYRQVKALDGKRERVT